MGPTRRESNTWVENNCGGTRSMYDHVEQTWNRARNEFIAIIVHIQTDSDLAVMVSFSNWIGGNRKRKYYRRILIKIATNRFFDGHLSPEWRQMAIENTVSSDF